MGKHQIELNDTLFDVSEIERIKPMASNRQTWLKGTSGLPRDWKVDERLLQASFTVIFTDTAKPPMLVTRSRVVPSEVLDRLAELKALEVKCRWYQWQQKRTQLETLPLLGKALLEDDIVKAVFDELEAEVVALRVQTYNNWLRNKQLEWRYLVSLKQHLRLVK